MISINGKEEYGFIAQFKKNETATIFVLKNLQLLGFRNGLSFKATRQDCVIKARLLISLANKNSLKDCA